MKILLLSDHPGIKSGYGKITNALATHLADKGHEVLVMAATDPSNGNFQEYKWDSRVGASNPIRVWNVADYGHAEHIRWFLEHEKPDVLWVNTDPRYLTHVFGRDIRRICPLVYYHLWDDVPFPKFNIPYYKSCDRIIAGSKFTYNLLTTYPTTSNLSVDYCPIGLDPEVYKPLEDIEKEKFSSDIWKKLKVDAKPNFVIGMISRDAPRKLLMDTMRVYAEWSDDKPDTYLFIHVPLVDSQMNLEYTMKSLYEKKNIVISQGSPDHADDTINRLYNFFDVSINKSDAEGFGMPIAESMLAGTPAISIDTQGPAGLITKDNGWLLPADIFLLLGDATVPYVGQRFVTDKTFMAALDEAYYNVKLRKEKAAKCRDHIIKNYHVKDMVEGIDKSLFEAIKNWTAYPELTIHSWPKVEGTL
jgi:glycosyltransferase involved in cell wall biosynthesis